MSKNYEKWKDDLVQEFMQGVSQGTITARSKKLRSELVNALKDAPFNPDFDINNEYHTQLRSTGYAYMAITKRLRENPYIYPLAEHMLLEWWEVLGKRRFNQNEPYVYRANASMMLALYYLNIGDRGMALRWALLTHAEDAMQGWLDGEGKNLLALQFSLSEDSIHRLETLSQDCKNKASAENWASPDRFSEEVVRRFLLEKGSFPLYEYIPQRPIPISEAYFESLMNAFDKAINTDMQGKTMENLALYLVQTMPGCLPRPNMIFPKTLSETDVVVYNLNPTSSLTSEIFHRHFLIECKQFVSKRMESKDVGYFLHRMRLAHAPFGIIFSTNGITSGRARDENAYAHITRAFQENGSVCVVIDKNDLKEIRSGVKTFWWMLFEKIEEIRFGKSEKS